LATQTYNVDVKAYVNGTWGNYATVCTISVPAANPEEQRVMFDGVDTDEPEVNIYPNPASDHFTIEVLSSGAALAEVYDAVGKKVNALVVQGGRADVDAASLAPGIYFVKVVTENGTTTRKLIK
jgi:hypothetical protein